MKKWMTTLFLSALGGAFVFGQVNETKLQMSLGMQNGLRISIPEAKEDLIDKVWKKYTKDYGKLVKNKKAKEEMIEGANIPNISKGNPMDVYAMTEDYSISVFFDLRSGFLNSTDHPDAYAGASAFLQEFAYEVEREMTREELEKEQSRLKKLNQNMGDLLKDHKRYHQDIEEAKAKIKRAEDNIVTNEKDQKQTQSEIEGQTKVVARVQEKLNKIGKSK
jgi:hypothetical protein